MIAVDRCLAHPRASRALGYNLSCALLALCLSQTGIAAQENPTDKPPERSQAASPDSARLNRESQLGPVIANIELTPARPRFGDTLQLEIEVRAPAEIELLMPEFGQSLERFAIVDFVPSRQVDSQGLHVYRQVYRLQTLRSGAQSIPRIMIEFVDRRPGQREAPDGEDAYELLTERIDFQVQSLRPQDAGDALKPALGALPALDPVSAPGKRTALWLVILLITMLGLVLGWRYWRGRARQRSAYEIASARLAALQARPLPGSTMDGSTTVWADTDAFFVELSDIVRRYLEGRFNLHAPELTSEEFLDVASGSPDLSSEHKRFLNEFLSISDKVKFARHQPAGQQVQSLLTSVQTFLTQTRDDQVQHA